MNTDASILDYKFRPVSYVRRVYAIAISFLALVP